MTTRPNQYREKLQRRDEEYLRGCAGCWAINPARARKYNLVLAHRRGIALGAVRPTSWMPSTKANFPWLEGEEDRWGFVGELADQGIAKPYVQKRVPDKYRVKGAANPIRYVEPLSVKG